MVQRTGQIETTLRDSSLSYRLVGCVDLQAVAMKLHEKINK